MDDLCLPIDDVGNSEYCSSSTEIVKSDQKVEPPVLICSNCENYLSIFPIYAYHAKKTFQFICGRCPSRTEVQLQRQIAYEMFAQDTIFPCRYKEQGCEKRLRPGELKEHEPHCPSRACSCPSLPRGVCKWTGTCSDLYEHFKDAHRPLTFSDPHRLIFSMKYSFINIYAVSFNEELILMHLRYDADTMDLSYSVGSVLTSNWDQYAISFSYGTKVYEYQKLSLSTKDGLNVSTDRSLLKVVNLKNVTQLVININKITSDGNHLSGTKADLLSHLHDEMFKCIECPVCMEYMRPPIMICEAGHSICKPCKSQIIECPTCREPFGDTRNFALEDFTRFVIYPCRNRDCECPIALPLDEIKAHERICRFKPAICPFSIDSGTCTWKNKLSSFVTHVKENHKGAFKNGTLISVSQKQNSYTHGVIEYDNNVFYMTYQYDCRFFLCSVGLVGPSTNYNDYMYEFQIKTDNAEDTIVVRRNCRLVRLYKLAFGTHCIKLYNDCVNKDFPKNISLYVRIMKKRYSNIDTID